MSGCQVRGLKNVSEEAKLGLVEPEALIIIKHLARGEGYPELELWQGQILAREVRLLKRGIAASEGECDAGPELGRLPAFGAPVNNSMRKEVGTTPLAGQGTDGLVSSLVLLPTLGHPALHRHLKWIQL